MKTFISKIIDLDWSSVDPYILIYQSREFAMEFARTVRSCMPDYNHIPEFREFISGEIDTNNLIYDSYNPTYFGYASKDDMKSDHYEFLSYFMERNPWYVPGLERAEAFEAKKRTFASISNLAVAMIKYRDFVDALSSEDKLATLISREAHLHGIFRNILLAHNWDKISLGFFQYFLERHIELDSVEGGHEALTNSLLDLSRHQDMLTVFWWHRWKVYETLYAYSEI